MKINWKKLLPIQIHKHEHKHDLKSTVQFMRMREQVEWYKKQEMAHCAQITHQREALTRKNKLIKVLRERIAELELGYSSAKQNYIDSLVKRNVELEKQVGGDDD